MSLHSDGAGAGVATEFYPVGRTAVSPSDGSGGGPHSNAERARRLIAMGEKAAGARLAGNEDEAQRLFEEIVVAALQVIEEFPTDPRSPDLRLQTAHWALECGDVTTARRLLASRATGRDEAESRWALIGDVDAWPDSWLIAAVRRTSPDEAALDALAQRHWRALFGRCRMLTLQPEAAADLAQDTWHRLLHGRERLRPGGNFRAYLLTIATNLWRDAQRAALRAGVLAVGNMTSLDAMMMRGGGPPVKLADLLPDLEQLEAAERDCLKNELDHALKQVDTLWRDVLVARFLDGESCAEIGRRYGRTEQTASGWVRRAISELRECLIKERRGAH